MDRKTKYAVGIVIIVLSLSLPNLLLAQDELTLESLAERVESLFSGQSELKARVEVIETRLAPTPTKTRRPTATPTKQRPSPTATAFSTPTPTPLLRVSAEQVFDDYRKYEGMTFEVSGEVIKKWDDKIELHVPGWLSYFICWLSPDQEDLPLVLNSRQYVVLQGKDVSKNRNTVSMRSCTFVSPSPVELSRLNATRVASTATARSARATATAKSQETRASERATQAAAKATKQAVTATAQAKASATRAVEKVTQQAVNATATARARTSECSFSDSTIPDPPYNYLDCETWKAAFILAEIEFGRISRLSLSQLREVADLVYPMVATGARYCGVSASRLADYVAVTAQQLIKEGKPSASPNNAITYVLMYVSSKVFEETVEIAGCETTLASFIILSE